MIFNTNVSRWGHKRQGWDIITATHFAVSALATGGLTGPEVNANGVLPTEPAIFCGVFCLFGIPLFALTLGHFARVLVEGYVAAVEEKAVIESIVQPLDVTEFEYAKHLCSTDSDVHLSDFIVLQLLRQGKVLCLSKELISHVPCLSIDSHSFIFHGFILQVDIRMVHLIKIQFEALDIDKSGVISFANMQASEKDRKPGDSNR